MNKIILLPAILHGYKKSHMIRQPTKTVNRLEEDRIFALRRNRELKKIHENM